jgi:ubiquinone/menaquinone biosynthesis C-methylase UbiE
MLKSLTEYFIKVRQECWEIIDKRYPEEKNKYMIIQDLVEQSLANGCVILDAGCGHRSVVSDHHPFKVTKIGADMVLEDIKANKSLDFGLQASLSCIPLKDESVDLIVCNMVFEHLQQPEHVLAELSRVLKKGGHLIFMTVCIYNIFTVISKMIPNHFHKKLCNLLTNIKESDIFPTFYKANSVRKIRKMLASHNVFEKKVIMYQSPPYAFVFSKTVCKLVLYYYHILNKYEQLKFLRGVIIGQYQKL